MCILVRIQPLQDSEETIHGTKINTSSFEPPWFLSLRKNKTKFSEQANNQDSGGLTHYYLPTQLETAIYAPVNTLSWLSLPHEL